MAASAQSIDVIWPNLENGMTHVLTKLIAGFTFKQHVTLYTAVYDFCTRGPGPQRHNARSNGAHFYGEELYVRVTKFLEAHVKTLMKKADGKRNEPLLVYYKNEWDTFNLAMRTIDHLFAYLNRHWIKREAEDQKKGVYDIFTLGLVTWRDHFFKPVKEHLRQAVLDMIKHERDGEQIEGSLVQGVVKGFVNLSASRLGLTKDKEESLDIYKEDFAIYYIEESEHFYRNESSQFIIGNSVADYMKKVETRLHEEIRRVESYLHASTLGELTKTLEKVLIDKHKEPIQSEFPKLLEDDKVEDLTRMYALLNRIHNGLDPLKVAFENHVHRMGMNAVSAVAKAALNDPKKYVEELLRVYKKYNALVIGPFKSDVGFVASLDKACRRFINDNEVCKLAKSAAKSPELLAKFTDNLLRKTNKGQEEQEVEELLNDVMVLFKYIEERDVFLNFYSKLLAKRLIYEAFASEDTESSMIGKLKAACGYEYTSKLQRMFTDKSLCRDINDRFKQYCEDKRIDVGVDYFILVLATGSWPLQPTATDFSMPKELQTCATAFQSFYQGQHTGRKLNWLHHLSKGEVKTRYTTTNKAGYTLQCSAYQMGVLLQFNQQDSISVKDLQIATKLTENVLIHTLRTLVKTKVLLVEPSIDEEKPVVTPAHVFSLNKAFKSVKGRMKVNINIRIENEAGGEKERSKEDEDTYTNVNEERKILIQAAIVRVMKARRKLQHANLVMEVVSQVSTRFKPQSSLIKRCIDILIEKEYLERVQGERDMYSYVA